MADELIRYTLDLANQFNQIVKSGGLAEQEQDRINQTITDYWNTIMPVLKDPNIAVKIGEAIIINPFYIADLYGKSPEQFSTEMRAVFHSDESPRINLEVAGVTLFRKHTSGVIFKQIERILNPDIENLFGDKSSHWVIVPGYSASTWGLDLWSRRPHYVVEFVYKELELEDLLQYPQLFPKLVEGVNNLFATRTQEELVKVEDREKTVGLRILEESVDTTVPGIHVTLPPGEPLTPTQVKGIVDEAIAHNSRVINLEQNGATKQDLQQLLTALMETTAKDTRRSHDSVNLQQAYATLRQSAHGNPEAEVAVEAFIQNSPNLADPERVINLALKIIGVFVPQVQGVVSVLGALNTWINP